MARPYRLGKRAERVAETRQRIIDAARDLITESGVHDTSLGAVARRAKSTRTTVYHQFGSRGQLLVAMMNDALARNDVRGLRRAAAERDAAIAVRMMLRALCRFWASDYVFFGRIKGLANIDPAIAEVNTAQVETRRGDLAQLAHRLAAQGGLRAGCSERKALDTLLLLTSFEVFDELHGRSQMSADAVAATLVDMAERTLLA